MFRLAFQSIFLIVISIAFAAAQEPAKWKLVPEQGRQELAAGQRVEVRLQSVIDSGWHLYALDQPKGGPVATTIKVTNGAPFQLEGEIAAPKPIEKPDQQFTDGDGKPLITRYYENSVEFIVHLKAASAASIDGVSLDVRFQVCNDTFCLPPRTVTVTSSGFSAVKKTFTDEIAPDPVKEAGPASGNANAQTYDRALPNEIWPFIWLAITLGALSLLTPCVFPMIPITVSYFTNHAAGDRRRSIKLATIYSLGIIATFTILGMLLAIFVGAAGINLFAANPWINLLITAIFLFFAFNLFGAYEIAIPAPILTKLDAITRSQEGEGGGVVGALLMGLTFTLTSFTCTSPFVGTILVSASQGDWQMPLVGMLAFSTVFALPFFVLAIAPQLISQLPRAGGWMNSIKVAMGFLEVAAAMKFLSNVDLVWKWGIFTRDVVLAVWIAIGVVLTMYLLGKFQLAHDSKPERLGAFRMAAAVVSLAVSFYLLTGLFGAKLGELESFLPPATAGSGAKLFGQGEQEPVWIENDLDRAIAQARSENKRVFIDFTGYTCTNCRWMEANVFPKPEVVAELRDLVLVRLYTDGVGEIYERQQQLEQDMLGTVALPYYAILDDQRRVVISFPGLTRNTAEFVDFLKKGKQN